MSGPLLRVTGVTKSFSGIAALVDVDLDVEPGERVSLIGPNGAGKTTLFNGITGVIGVDRGTIELEGRDISDLPVHRRARLGIGRTFQRIELFPGSTVRDHLNIADRMRHPTRRLMTNVRRAWRPDPAERARTDEMLELLGLGDLADEPIERLSLGQGRLVEVGRALQTGPSLLLLDEPSSGLDRQETAALAATLREVQEEQGFAILLVEHDIELVASFTTRSFLLDFGRVIASGPTAEIMASDAMRQAYLGELEVS